MGADAKKRIEVLDGKLRELHDAIGADGADHHQLLDQYAALLRDYVLIEDALRRAKRSLDDLRAVEPLESLPDVSRMLHTTLPGTRIAKLVVTQVFRIHDLLVAAPESLRPTSVLQNMLDPNALRRTLNRNTTLELPGLGTLRSVRSTQLELRDFWARATPPLSMGGDPPICFVPFEMTPLPMLEGFRPDIASVIEETLKPVSALANVQIDSRMRLYSPGVGVVRISITLTFAEVVYVEVLARIAREIESLLFVGPGEQEKGMNAFLDDAVRALIAALFVDESAQDAERRWRPPDLAFVLYDEGIDPAANVSSLAHLVALSPGNLEASSSIETRLQRVIASNEWAANGILAFAGHRSSLLLGSNKGGRAVMASRKNTVAMLLELQEVIAAAAYVQQLFEEKLQEITAGGLLDATWGEPGEKLAHLMRLMRAMRHALRAVMSLKLQLEQHGAGVLVPFARQLWALRYRQPSTPLPEQLRILSAWLTEQTTPNDDLREIASLAHQVGSYELPFKPGAPLAQPASTNEETEADLLRNLDELETLIAANGEASIARVQELVAGTMRIKTRLGIA